MKYGHEWREVITTLPDCMQLLCISYADWKNRLKYNPKDTRQHWQEWLTHDCQHADTVFSKRMGVGGRVCFPWFGFASSGNVATCSLENKIAFCRINAKTLYKICKKLKKMLSVPAMDWYTSNLSEHTFSFTGSGKLTSWMLHKCEERECPICLEDACHLWLVMRCGHYVCFDCANKYWKLDDIHANIYNKLAIISRRHSVVCPVCRIRDPWRAFPNAIVSVKNN